MAHIFLYGPPGSGKSTLGKALADRLGMPFVDLDQAVEARAGLTISELMRERGENAFRITESRALQEQVRGPCAVIALGGGTLLREENRGLADAKGTVICLWADEAQLLQRLQADARPRPLLAGELHARLAALLAARQSHYDSFAARVDTSQPVDAAVQQLQAVAGRFHLSAMGSCDVILERGLIDGTGACLRAEDITRTIVVTDENVGKLYAEGLLDSLRSAGFEPALLTISAGEGSKTLDTVSQLWRGFLQADLDRRSMVIALGGGVVGDLAGFAASTFMRGVRWICLPTTLLAMVDASIGGKTGFDLPEGKNLVGSFHTPRLVLCDPDVLGTLPEAELRAGMAEVLKHAVISEPRLFELCAAGLVQARGRVAEIVRRAIAVKVAVIESDPYEQGPRAVLNFGHTVGHAIELVSAFSIRHGEAVAMGMVAETGLSERLGLARPGLRDEIAQALSGLGLPIRIPAHLPWPKLVLAMQADKKKSGGVVRFALPLNIGRVQPDVPVRELSSAFKES